MIGYRARLATIACWFLVMSIHNRNPMILSAGDILLRLLLFWAMFLPLGARYSVDAALDKNPSVPRSLCNLGLCRNSAADDVYVFFLLHIEGRIDVERRHSVVLRFKCGSIDSATRDLDVPVHRVYHSCDAQYASA